MGYTVTNLITTKQCVQVTSIALLIVYAINFFCQFIVTCCISSQHKDSKRNKILERLLETSRVLYWFPIATMFSIYPPFYYGIHSAALAFATLIVVVLMHIFCFSFKCDKQRSVWSYFYFFYHLAVGIWITVALILGYSWALDQSVPSDSNVEN